MRFLAKLLEHWKLYLIPIVLLPILATFYGQHTLSVYESSAYILVQRGAVVGSTTLGAITGNPYNSPAQNAVDAIGELLQSENFAVRVAQHTDLARMFDLSVRTGADIAAARIQREVSVAPSPVGQDAFTITVDDKLPQLAQQIATSLIDQFTTDYTQRQIDSYKQAEALLAQQIASVSGQASQDLQRVNQYMQAHPSVSSTTPDAPLAAYEQQYQQDLAQVKTLKDQQSMLELNRSTIESGNLRVFDVLDQPRQPLLPTLKLKKLIVYPGIGLGLALALIALIVGLQTVFDRGIYTRDDVRSIVEDLDLDIASIEAVPVLHGIGDRQRDEDEGGTYSGVLVPVLTVLPHLGSEEMTQELRRAVGVGADDSR